MTNKMIAQNKVIDQDVRDELLNPRESFIVQAPAGSGKTELLTQRILALLAVVEKPENILAITFTKKAAAEMQSRVISALQLAKQTMPDAAHEQHRWKLAKKVLDRDIEKNWHLLENPARLNLMTIDSFSSSLSSALPLLSQTGTLPKIAENATQYYDEAADNLLKTISDGGEIAENIKQLLRHKDNNLNQVSELIGEMLNKRMQWLASIQNHAQEFNQKQLTRSLQIIISEKLLQAYHAIPHDIICELPELLNQAAQVLSKKEGNKKINLSSLNNVGAIISPDHTQINLWKAIAELFLKSNSAELLSTFNIGSGFPPEKDSIDEIEKQQFKRNKKQVTQIANELRVQEGIAEILFQIKLLPDNIEASLNQKSLAAVVALLPMAVAHLKLVFCRHNIIDFPELLLASLEALGHPDLPSDLALALDYKLQHILIDEFQDTSTPQVELLKLLTAGWGADESKTLFLVGDPMQSIYRFRDANVSLFMQIRDQGIADIKLKFRQLQVNFRSNQVVVDWVNQQFQNIMPDTDDLGLSAVSYAKSVAFKPDNQSSLVQSLFTIDAPDHFSQAEKILQLCQQHLAENKALVEKKSLAILARSRNNLYEIIQLLNKNEIQFQAVEIDKLSQKMLVKDLISLAFSLCDLYDELHWAACMRSPWFGLGLDDVRQVMHATDSSLPIPQRIQLAVTLMSDESQKRCQLILPILNATINYKAKKPFRKWLWGCFVAVGGLAQIDFKADHENLMVCLDKLDSLSEGGELNDHRMVDDAIDKLYAAFDVTADAQIQIMTIHKSKGLEFDTVILPRLDSGKRAGDQALIKWTEILDNDGQGHSLLAISKQTGESNEALYNYISYVDKRKASFEDQRVLYVAVTRAKEKLYLLGAIETDSKVDAKVDAKSSSKSESESKADEFKKPASMSFLSLLWEGEKDNFSVIDYHHKQVTTDQENTKSLYQTRYIKQVKLSNVLKIPSELDAQTPHLNEELFSAEKQQSKSLSGDILYQNPSIEVAAIVGSVLHRQLQWASENYNETFNLPNNWEQITRSQLMQLYQFKHESELDSAVLKVMLGLKNTLDDPFGQIILSAADDANSELILHKKLDQGSFLTRIIDRTFIYQNKRWIIDYKSSQPEQSESLSIFIQKEKQLYLDQINDYFKMFVKIEARPIVAGLYFPMISHFEKMIEN